MHPLRQAPASSNVQCECVIVQLAQKRQYPAIFFTYHVTENELLCVTFALKCCVCVIYFGSTQLLSL